MSLLLKKKCCCAGGCGCHGPSVCTGCRPLTYRLQLSGITYPCCPGGAGTSILLVAGDVNGDYCLVGGNYGFPAASSYRYASTLGNLGLTVHRFFNPTCSGTPDVIAPPNRPIYFDFYTQNDGVLHMQVSTYDVQDGPFRPFLGSIPMAECGDFVIPDNASSCLGGTGGTATLTPCCEVDI